MADEQLCGDVEVSESDDDQVLLSFLNKDGTYHWFKFSRDAAIDLAQRLDWIGRRGPEFERRLSERTN